MFKYVYIICKYARSTNLVRSGMFKRGMFTLSMDSTVVKNLNVSVTSLKISIASDEILDFAANKLDRIWLVPISFAM